MNCTFFSSDAMKCTNAEAWKNSNRESQSPIILESLISLERIRIVSAHSKQRLLVDEWHFLHVNRKVTLFNQCCSLEAVALSYKEETHVLKVPARR